MTKCLIAIMTSLGLFAGAVAAASQTVTLSVPSMTCSTCPITVRKALSRVDGVLDVKVTWEPKEAVVTYDDRKTTVEVLLTATANSGYPSQLKSETK